MNPLLADSFYFLALRNPRDQAHARARAITPQIVGRTLVTTAWVLTEIGDALAAPMNRAGFSELVQFLRSNPQVMIIPPEAKLFEQGIEFYNRRPDKAWSLTDCISFVVMTDLGISEALTGDHHFEQAGFRALLK
jgi:predicted nucleic acid-binding protein